MVNRIRLITFLLGAGWMFMSYSMLVHATSAEVTATVDRKVITQDQSLQLSILIQGEAHGRPDTRPLEKSFEIVSSGQSSSYTFINGRQHRETQLSYTLFPRHAGKLIIPSLKVGDLQTAPIEITVSDSNVGNTNGHQATKKPDIWLEAKLDHDSVYVQQQLILTIHIFQGVKLAQAQLSELEVPEMLVKPFGEDHQFQENRDGRIWTVTERRYALFPQKSGKMSIPSIRLEGQAMMASNNFFFSTTRPVRARSESLSVDVLPIPPEWHQSYWLPASDLALTDSWSADEFKVGESVTRRLKIVAKGLLSSQLPPLSVVGDAASRNNPLKFYYETPGMKDTVDSGDWQGIREESMAILPIQAGDVSLPEIKVVWWDTDDDKTREAVIPARVLHISAQTLSQNPAVTPGTRSSEGKSMIDNKNENSAPHSGLHADSSLWVWKSLSLLGLSGWLVALWLWRRAAGTVKSQKPVLRGRETFDYLTSRALRRKIIQAAKAGEGHASEQALLRYFSRMSGKRFNNLQEIQPYCDTKLLEAVKDLEHHLYSKRVDGSPWDGQPLVRAFHQYHFRPREPDGPHHKEDLFNLYPSV